MDLNDKNSKIYLVGIDGGLRLIPGYLVPELQKKGWHIVHNPKRTYFPEYDQTSPHYKKEQNKSEESNILEIKIL